MPVQPQLDDANAGHSKSTRKARSNMVVLTHHISAVRQKVLLKTSHNFIGRGGWAYALVQRVDGEEDQFEFVSPVRLFIVRD